MSEIDSANSRFRIKTLQSQEDWEGYFDLRWRVLRAAWKQPRGSERDDLETESIHVMLCDVDRSAAAIGRLHFNSAEEAQVRYMAVDPKVRRQGLGTTVLAALESEAVKRGARRIVLNAREQAISFYERHGYVVIVPAETLFGEVAHTRMQKDIDSKVVNSR